MRLNDLDHALERRDALAGNRETEPHEWRALANETIDLLARTIEHAARSLTTTASSIESLASRYQAGREYELQEARRMALIDVANALEHEASQIAGFAAGNQQTVALVIHLIRRTADNLPA